MSDASDVGRPGRRLWLFAVPVLLFAAVFVGAGVVGPLTGSPRTGDPFIKRSLFTWSDSAVADVASAATGDDAAIFRRMAAVPTAVWLTPEQHPVRSVGSFVGDVVSDAEAQRQTPVFVVYGIPGRDCSGKESSGGLPVDQYADWVAEIADATGSHGVVILEPDALATAGECGNTGERVKVLRSAVDELSRGGPTVYVDAGHASWTEPAVMAQLLQDVGIDSVRGFSTNVSGYESEQDERAYADEVSRLVGGSHFVTDTSRNGVGSNGEWCNPVDRALGRAPSTDTDGDLDAYLWIKPPGESDGVCGGGPGAGVFWPERALELARAAGW